MVFRLSHARIEQDCVRWSTEINGQRIRHKLGFDHPLSPTRVRSFVPAAVMAACIGDIAAQLPDGVVLPDWCQDSYRQTWHRIAQMCRVEYCRRLGLDPDPELGYCPAFTNEPLEAYAAGATVPYQATSMSLLGGGKEGHLAWRLHQPDLLFTFHSFGPGMSREMQAVRRYPHRRVECVYSRSPNLPPRCVPVARSGVNDDGARHSASEYPDIFSVGPVAMLGAALLSAASMGVTRIYMGNEIDCTNLRDYECAGTSYPGYSTGMDESNWAMSLLQRSCEGVTLVNGVISLHETLIADLVWKVFGDTAPLIRSCNDRRPQYEWCCKCEKCLRLACMTLAAGHDPCEELGMPRRIFHSPIIPAIHAYPIRKPAVQPLDNEREAASKSRTPPDVADDTLFGGLGMMWSALLARLRASNSWKRFLTHAEFRSLWPLIETNPEVAETEYYQHHPLLLRYVPKDVADRLTAITADIPRAPYSVFYDNTGFDTQFARIEKVYGRFDGSW